MLMRELFVVVNLVVTSSAPRGFLGLQPLNPSYVTVNNLPFNSETSHFI